MKIKRVVLISAILGLIVPVIALTLLSFGLPSDFVAHDVNLTQVLWPPYVMLVVGWHSTFRGIFITISAVAINCLIYVTIALLLRTGFREIRKIKS